MRARLAHAGGTLLVLLLLTACNRVPSQLPLGPPQGLGVAGTAAAVDVPIARAGAGGVGVEAGAAPNETVMSEGVPLDDATLIAMGATVYATNCAPCHHPNGEGSLTIFPALNRNAFVTVNDPRAVISTVLHGREIMPAFEATLSPQEVAAVISYIRNSWNNQAPVVRADQVRESLGGRTE